MATVNQVIERLRRRQIESAQAALLTPQDPTEFGFGVASGTYRAYEQMLADINELLDEDKQAEKRREQSK